MFAQVQIVLTSMVPAGLEPHQITADHNNNLRDPVQGSAAESGAVGAPPPPIDPDLVLLIERWDSLPEPVRAGIVAMVKAAAGKDGQR